MKFTVHFFRTFLPLFFVIAAAGIYIDGQKTGNGFDNIVEEQERQLLLKHEFILHFFDPLIFDTYYLTQEGIMAGYLEDSARWREVVEEWRLFEHARKTYDQIRMIGSNGRERIRVNYRHDSAYAIAGKLLQDRNNTDYFRESMKLRPGEIYISPAELTVEFGKVDMPYTPVIYTGMGLFDKHGNRKGVLIVNYMMKDFLTQVDRYYATDNAECSLLNSDGYWLEGPERYVTFGFMFTDNRRQHSFANQFPRAWRAMRSAESGHVQTENGLFVYRTIHLFQSLQRSGLVQKNRLNIPGQSNWILVSHVSPTVLQLSMSGHGTLLWGIVGFMVLASALVAYIITYNYMKEMRSKEEIQQINQKLTEHEKELEQRAMELTRKNKELEQFAYITSHDLQEPLRMVSSFLQLLEKRLQGQLDETTSQYIHFAVDGAERMKELIQDLLQYSRIGFAQPDMEPTDLNIILERVLRILEEPIRQNEAKIIHHQLPVVNANPTQMEQLFLNLAENALKYRNKQQPVIEIGCRDQGDKWAIYVKDNGIGIDPKFFDKIFVIFQRLHNRGEYPGTGIGLAICKKIVEQHGGALWVESFPDGGSTFSFTIKK